MLGREVNAHRGSVASLVLLAGVNRPYCLAIKREYNHPTQPAKQQHSAPQKHLLGRKGLPGGWGLHGSGSYLPVVGHSLTERTGTSRRTWLCIPCPAKVAPGSLELSGCPLYSTKQPTAKCQESQAKTCAPTSQEMLSYAELVVLLFTAKHVAFPNEMLVVTEKTEDEWCKISFPCSRFLIPSSPGSLGSLDSLPTPALLVVLATLCSTECFFRKARGPVLTHLVFGWKQLWVLFVCLIFKMQTSDSLW